jgi:transposase
MSLLPPLKIKTVTAAERDAALRATFALDLALNLDPADLVSVDESSTHLALTRRSARAPQGQRAIGFVPRNHGTPKTLISALSPGGIQAALTVPGAVDQLAFRAFVREILGPSLRPGQVVATDNLSVHHDPKVRALIEERDCLLIHFPAYSPDLAPVEMAIAKIKAHLRHAAARTQEALDQAITEALARITPQDARGFFRHAGYPCRSNHNAHRSGGGLLNSEE